MLRIVLYLCAWLPLSVASAQSSSDSIQFNRDIRPILSDHCFACHGPDATHRQADLRLDDREAAIGKLAIVPGKPDESELFKRIASTDPDAVMPPPSSHKKLSTAQKEILTKWIEQGAQYQKHWSYELPIKVATPAHQHPIDYLVRQQLISVGSVKPSPPADRQTLARRLHFDLLGLPPAPETVEAFIHNSADNAYEELVDRLLVSPHYGERMAIAWLDVVRFADTIGYHSDNPRNVWPYRDWVIDSFNRNKPFDRFTREQLAGDLLLDANQESLVGSAFNRLLLSTEEGGAQPKDYESRMLTDRVRAVGTAWLGQTTGCAQCHDHKFDPFTTKDFYALGAFFADIKESAVGRREEGMLVCPSDQQAEWDQLKSAVKTVQEQASSNPSDEATANHVKQTQAALKTFETNLPRCLVTTQTPQKRTVRILPRGNWMDESGPQVKPALPAYLVRQTDSNQELTRLDLANWLVSRDNPLTARTVMNRLWKQFFGVALSRVAEDLGAQGEPPSHPELLDWLAVELIDSGWNIKHMVRLIVTSDTYRQSSQTSEQLRSIDPNNRLLARQSAWRLEAELVRDNALAISGLLNRQIGGASVKPYQPDGYWENLNFPTRDYETDLGSKQYRRGLYVWWQRSFLHPSLLAFDAPSREECTADRNRSNLPQQALVLLNDPTYVEAARALAVRTLTEVPHNNAGQLDDARLIEQRIVWTWQQALQREPTSKELEQMQQLLIKHRALYQQDPAAAEQLLKIGQTPLPAELDPVELASWTHLARVLLNLHETITRN